MTTITIHTRLESEVVKLPQAKELIGKEVEITIRETASVENRKKREWKYLGYVDLGGKLDNINIRDLAYE